MSESTKKNKSVFSGISIRTVFHTLTIALPIILALVLFIIFKIKVNNAKKLYSDKMSTISTAITEGAYNLGEKNNHISNDISVAINSLTEESRIEVLKVQDVEYITDETNERGTVTSWLKVTGEGTYTIDLKSAEYLYDSVTKTITVVLRNPEITYCRLLHAENILYEDSRLVGNGTIKDGEALAQRQIQEGYKEVYNYFRETPQFFQSAKNSAISIVTSLVKQLYDENADINVSVVFI